MSTCPHDILGSSYLSDLRKTCFLIKKGTSFVSYLTVYNTINFFPCWVLAFVVSWKKKKKKKKKPIIETTEQLDSKYHSLSQENCVQNLSNP